MKKIEEKGSKSILKEIRKLNMYFFNFVKIPKMLTMTKPECVNVKGLILKKKKKLISGIKSI